MPRRSIWQAATGDAAPVPVAEPVAVVHEPIKAAELAKELKAEAKRIMQSDTTGGWRPFAAMERETGRVCVWVRKHGATVRYSTTPITST